MCHYKSEKGALISAGKCTKSLCRPGPTGELTALPQVPSPRSFLEVGAYDDDSAGLTIVQVVHLNRGL